MITISNYTTKNNKDDELPLFINSELLQKYREHCDTCLVNIKRELTRSLVDYKLFQELQQVNNNFFVIVDYLECEHYTTLKEIEDDNKKLISDVKVFTKHCKSCIALDIYKTIFQDCDDLILTVHKLVQIVKTVNKGV